MPFSIPKYTPILPFRNGHVHTIYSYLIRKSFPQPFQRVALATPDEDFIDVDWGRYGNTKCTLLVHGLEGSAESAYISSIGRVLVANGWDVALLNLRGCSGTNNKLYRAYHSGSTDDLQTAVKHFAPFYTTLAIVGFSLGGNIVLKYMPSCPEAKVKAAVGVSVPCHLSSSSDRLEEWDNYIYNRRFVHSLKQKLALKMTLFPDQLSQDVFKKINSIRGFDDVYTAPANGFKDAEDYYTNCSSVFGLSLIRTPTLLINSQDDPFLTPLCMPQKEAEENPHFHFYAPKHGGHVGFLPEAKNKPYKHEEWILAFLTAQAL